MKSSLHQLPKQRESNTKHVKNYKTNKKKQTTTTLPIDIRNRDSLVEEVKSSSGEGQRSRSPTLLKVSDMQGHQKPAKPNVNIMAMPLLISYHDYGDYKLSCTRKPFLCHSNLTVTHCLNCCHSSYV